MESVIKVLYQVCKTYCGKTAPSKKEVGTVLSFLVKEGLLSFPYEIYDSSKWDSLTLALAQRAMSSQGASVLKFWGLIRGALKAAREEKTAKNLARDLLGLDPGGGGSPRPGDSNPFKDLPQDKMAPEAPTLPETPTPEKKEEESPSSPTAPPPYPLQYPSLHGFRQGEDPTRVGVGAGAEGLLAAAPPSGAERLMVAALPPPPVPPSQTARVPANLGKGALFIDWGRVREEMRAAELLDDYKAFPVEIRGQGPVWVPLDLLEIIQPLRPSLAVPLAGQRNRRSGLRTRFALTARLSHTHSKSLNRPPRKELNPLTLVRARSYRVAMANTRACLPLGFYRVRPL
ncbi:uncharacterized protein LOC125688622 [Lagopus muta]|uniref:uncharacterized protein LOC125688622 n=1 Tax=Lagopus muta TaxID=64668 RepID=UPI00209CF143|nr:uncharacterized protein LOC125688622 [Lagopus muta]